MPADINVIAENLSELLTNSVNMTAVFYDLFINPEPMDITLKQYDDNNRLIDVIVPNRAKDRRIALTGEGNPEGKVNALVGTCYVDTLNNLVYFKARGEGSTGWVVALTESSLRDLLKEYVPSTRKVNNKALATDITLNANDVGALGKDTSYGNSLSVAGSNLNLRDQTGKVISTVPIADGGADIDLSNISPLAEKRLNVVKGYRTGEVTEDERMFNQLLEMKHSTFEKGKFTIVGTPTITDDGIASGFSDSNFIQVENLGVNSSTLDFEIGFTIPKLGKECRLINLQSDTTNATRLIIDASANFSLLSDNETLTTPITIPPDWVNDFVVAKVHTNTNGNEVFLHNTTKSVTLNSKSTKVTNLTFGSLTIGANLPGQEGAFIDLKQFSVSVDGKEVFSGNKTGVDKVGDIEIPYTESKTGSKIVDSIYRDRVKQVSDLEGKALYYTIDEANKNTTLPIGELYGFIGTPSKNNSSGHYLGEWIMASTGDNVTPEGCVKPDGLEILDAENSMFADLWKYALLPSEDWGTPGHPRAYLDTCTYAEYHKAVQDFGACIKWAVDPEAKKFKIPFVPDGYYMKQGKGTVNKAGLPNITAEWNSAQYIDGWNGNGGSKGAVYGIPNGSKEYNTNLGGMRAYFDASRSSPIYGASNTVETNAIGTRWFIYIANAELGDFAVNWNRMTGSIQGKANIDGDNFSKLGKELISGMGMPSNKFIDLSLGVSESTYTAPANGYYYALLKNATICNMHHLGCGGDLSSADFADGGRHDRYAWVPVKKGDVIQIWYSGEKAIFRFIYAQGEV